MIAFLLDEPLANWVGEQLGAAEKYLMSTVNLTECLIVLRQPKPDRADELVERFLNSSIEFVSPDISQSKLAATARLQYPFNLGDCFAYALAKTHGVPLLTLDRDFRNADVPLILPPET